MNKKNFCKRKCIVCKSIKHKDELYRFYFKDGFLELDHSNKNQNRGYYLCKNTNEILCLLNNKTFSKNKFKLNSNTIKFLKELLN